jgi:hypothetical protein
MRSQAQIPGQHAALMQGETLTHERSSADDVKHGTKCIRVQLSATHNQHGAALIRPQLPQVIA